MPTLSPHIQKALPVGTESLLVDFSTVGKTIAVNLGALVGYNTGSMYAQESTAPFGHRAN